MTDANGNTYQKITVVWFVFPLIDCFTLKTVHINIFIADLEGNPHKNKTENLTIFIKIQKINSQNELVLTGFHIIICLKANFCTH